MTTKNYLNFLYYKALLMLQQVLKQYILILNFLFHLLKIFKIVIFEYYNTHKRKKNNCYLKFYLNNIIKKIVKNQQSRFYFLLKNLNIKNFENQ